MPHRLIVTIAATALVLGAGLLLRQHYIGVGEDRVQARWDAQTQSDALRTAEQLRIAEQIERTKENIRRTHTERIAHENDQLRQALDERSRTAVAAERSLHTTIAALRSQLHAATSASGIDAHTAASIERASTTAELLGACAGRYGAVAADADRLAVQVTGLQDWIRHICHDTTE